MEKGLKKLRFFDGLLWTILISFVLTWLFFFLGASMFLYTLPFIVFSISSIIFTVGILYLLFKNKHYLLFFLSIFLPIKIVCYLTVLRKEFKE